VDDSTASHRIGGRMQVKHWFQAVQATDDAGSGNIGQQSANDAAGCDQI